MTFIAGVVALAVATAVTCSLPGVFVVLRRSAMLVDAISHAVLPGIVLGYALTHDLRSPVLVVGAAVMGLVVVLGNEYLTRTGLIAGDAPAGLVFPALFSIGVLLVSANFAHVHLDVHAVLVGDLNLAAFDQWMLGGISLGPTYLYVVLAVLALNAGFIAVFWRQLTVSTFDPEYARVSGIAAGAINVAFMLLVSITVTTAFHAAGAVLVIALVVIPAATARLLVSTLGAMVTVSLIVASGGAILGFAASYLLDAATSAGMAVSYGVVFAAALAVRAVRGRMARPTVPQEALRPTA